MTRAELVVGLKLKEQKASGAAKNQQENRNVNRSSKKIIALPPQQQQMSAQKEQDIARFQQTDSMSAARTESTLTQKSLATVSIESSTAFEWTSPFESGYALLKGHA
jgi:hypothetical protein